MPLPENLMVTHEEKVFQWYLKSAEGGNSNGQDSLGNCYSNRIGTTKDEEKAVTWYSKSSESGDKYGQEIKKNKWIQNTKNNDVEVTVKYFDNNYFCSICWRENGCNEICIKYYQNFAEWTDIPEELFGFYNSNQVSLKKLKNSQQIINFHCRDKYVLPISGITQDPKTKSYALILQYMKDGNLMNFLEQNKTLPWKERLWLLNSFIRGLETIHSKGFIHRDHHPGNLMITEAHNNCEFLRLGDLGLCRPVNEILSSGTYGVLPYIAPEVINQNPYTVVSDIYSVGIIMWVISGKIPFEGELYDPLLAMTIFSGHRLKVHKRTPQCYVELMEKCWHENPAERPSAETIFVKLEEWIRDLTYFENEENANQKMQNVDSESLYNETSFGIHPIGQPLMRHSSLNKKSKYDLNKFI
ncbi:hypothetical protein Glove_19g64 [Diversispora epigaea]|uniref:Protein kinase domain-containing protein n=1 Tax=Diversispora epigaea TaxID=1348612 RepID=A0A397JQ30_9GLOM|nr:hypothetical protein Glove_19g64 [Diversispora epigaea]